jgi:hypothetical protein
MQSRLFVCLASLAGTLAITGCAGGFTHPTKQMSPAAERHTVEVEQAEAKQQAEAHRMVEDEYKKYKRAREAEAQEERE